MLQAGYYVFTDQSYCLHAGTHGPGGGDGYLYAPPKGPAEDAVMSILHNSARIWSVLPCFLETRH